MIAELCERVAAQAQPGEGVEAYALEDTDLTVRVHAGEVESLERSRGRGVGIRVVADGRVGYAYTADVSEEAVADTLAAARANARAGTPDEANRLPDPAPLAAMPELYDDAFAETSVEEKIALALRLDEAARRGGPGVKGVDTARYADGVRHIAIASSTGIAGSYRRCDAYAIVEVLGERDGTTTQAYGLDYGRLPSDLDVEAAAAEGVQRAVRLLGGRKPPSQRLPVVFDPFAAASLLGVVTAGLSAESVQKGRSLFAGKVGERVAAEGVWLADDATLAAGPGAAPWDDEGVPTSRTELIDDGVLTGFLHNTVTAARGGTVSTGNAGRAGFRSLPGVRAANLHLRPGSAAPEDVLAQAGTGFYCQQILGLHSGANPVSGEFSVGAAGLMIRDGAFAESVREATIAGTIPEILAGIATVGADLRFLPFGGGVGALTLLIDELALSGT